MFVVYSIGNRRGEGRKEKVKWERLNERQVQIARGRDKKKEKTDRQITEKEQNGNKICMRKGEIKRTIARVQVRKKKSFGERVINRNYRKSLQAGGKEKSGMTESERKNPKRGREKVVESQREDDRKIRKNTDDGGRNREILRQKKKGRMRESERQQERWKNKVALQSKIEYGERGDKLPEKVNRLRDRVSRVGQSWRDWDLVGKIRDWMTE